MRNATRWVGREYACGGSVPLLLVLYLLAGIMMPLMNRYAAGVSVFRTCWLRCANPVACGSLSLRGRNYRRDADPVTRCSLLRGCLLTFWGVMHILFYAAIGYVCPRLAPAAWLLGAAFEAIEMFARVACPWDLLWNAVGLMIGVSLRYAIDPPDRGACRTSAPVKRWTRKTPAP